MKKQHPITYEQLALVGWIVMTVFVSACAILFVIGWKPKPNIALTPYYDTPPLIDEQKPTKDMTVRSVVCYYEDGTGPAVNCPAKIECHNEVKTNSQYSLIPCPTWPNF